MNILRPLLVALLCLAGACSDAEPRTQLTFRISASQALRNSLNKLNVTVRSSRGRDDRSETYTRGELRDWPVEIVVLPIEGNDSSYRITLIVAALDAQDAVLAQTPAIGISGTFVPGKHQIVNIPLDGGDPETDAGPTMDGGREEDSGPVDAGTDTGPAPQEDSGPAPETCATPGTAIACDDGNACNGVETCAPESAMADARGCVAGMNVSCESGMTCDGRTGECSRCSNTPDGDGDGVDALACMGRDCNDADPTIAPGKPELCDGKDNDCDDTPDGDEADPACASMAPTGGTASCESGTCVPRCNNAAHRIVAGVCMAPPVTCPAVNPCDPGTCSEGASSYMCTCPNTHRAGVGATRCAPRGVVRQVLGFETDCAGAATPGAFEGDFKQVPATLYASCGAASIVTGGLANAAQLASPTTTPIEDISGMVALAGGANAAGVIAAESLVIAFAPGVNELAFDALDLDNPAGVRVVLQGAGGAMLLDAMAAPTTGTKRARFTHESVAAIERATISYTQSAAGDAWYIDQLGYNVWGCGDGEREMGAGEACDDGNDLQCDGCDNACASSTNGCLQGTECLVGTPNASGLCAP